NEVRVVDVGVAMRASNDNVIYFIGRGPASAEADIMIADIGLAGAQPSSTLLTPPPSPPAPQSTFSVAPPVTPVMSAAAPPASPEASSVAPPVTPEMSAGAPPAAFTVAPVVFDDADAAMESEVARYGGAARLGQPLTWRFWYHGFVTQAFEKLVLQWRPDLGR